MRDKTTTNIALIIAALAFIQFIVLPVLRNQSATKIVKSILNDWTEENMLSPMNYWEDRNAYPNVAKLTAYKIRNHQIYKKNNVLFAKFHIDLKFADNNFMPKNSEWLFALKKTSEGWKIIDFRVSRLHPLDMVRKEAIYDANADRLKLNEMEKSHAVERQNQVLSEQKEEKIPIGPGPLKPIPKITPIQSQSTEGKRPGYRSIPALIK
ncbi:MAG: hypothetical protein AB7S78_04965 [Candidatus Omnitrophota bacterium]